MKETPTFDNNPDPQEHPDEAYAAAYAERYGLPAPEFERPQSPAPSQEDLLPEGYEQRVLAVSTARRAVESASPGEQKKAATLHLEDLEGELRHFIETKGTPNSPPIPGGKP